jgi:hypothetical protein
VNRPFDRAGRGAVIASDHDQRVRRRDFWLHLALFVAVNALYLVWAWPVWLWVTAIWSVGLGVHASLAFGSTLTQVTRRGGGDARER